jgi:molybdate transport system permease protein
MEIDWFPLWASLRVGAAATAISLLAGTPIGWALSRGRIPGTVAIEAVVLLPLVLPPTVLGLFLLTVIGTRSAFGRAWEAVTGGPLVFTLNAAVLAACVSAVPLVARIVRSALDREDPEIEEAARIDGAGRWAIAFHIVLPRLRGTLLAAAGLAFAKSVGDFGATLMVAGSIPGRTQTASMAIYDLANAGREGEALAYAAVLCAAALVVLVVLGGRRVA